ncbi:Nephrocystin-4, partial [Quaeritorhiza haematococci]
MCHLWPENVWIGFGDNVPGLRLLKSVPKAKRMKTATISKIQISVYPTIQRYEQEMLLDVVRAHIASSVLKPKKHHLPNHLALPTILERRIHLGFHNTFTFLDKPITTTLSPVYDDDLEDGFNLVFNGHLELSKYVPEERGIALVAVLEYKLCITMPEPVKKKKGIGAIIEKLGGSGTPGISGPVATGGTDATIGVEPNEDSTGSTATTIEKNMCLGWGFWIPPPYPRIYQGDEESPPEEHGIIRGHMPLNTQTGPNPYGTYVYAPHFQNPFSEDKGDDGSLVTGNESNLSDTGLKPRADEKSPVVLSFEFVNDLMPRSGRASPTREVLPEKHPPPMVDDATSPLDGSEVGLNPSVEPAPKEGPPPPPLPPSLPPSIPLPVHEKRKSDVSMSDVKDTDSVLQIDGRPPTQPYKVTAAQVSAKQRLWRIEKARLLKAGFKPVCLPNGQPLRREKAEDGSMEPEMETAGGGGSVRTKRGNASSTSRMGAKSRIKMTNIMDPLLETNDCLRVNEIGLTFMGITWNQDYQAFARPPESVYFTYHFYNFPVSATERLHIYTGPLPVTMRDKQQSRQSKNSGDLGEQLGEGHIDNHQTDDQLWPGIFYCFDENNQPLYNRPPGVTYTYEVDIDHDLVLPASLPTHMLPNPQMTQQKSPEEQQKPDGESGGFSRPPRVGGGGLAGALSKNMGRSAFFLRYMSENDLSIDIWDGDSLLYVGSSAVPLCGLLRQGRPGVLVEVDLDIFVHQSHERALSSGGSEFTITDPPSSRNNANGGNLPPTGAPVAAASSPVVVGKLHLRIFNVGYERHLTGNPLAAIRAPLSLSPPQIILGSFYERNKNGKIVYPKKMIEVDYELYEILTTAYQKRSEQKQRTLEDGTKDKNIDGTAVDPDKQLQIARNRKLDRLRRIRGKENVAFLYGNEKADDSSFTFTYQLTRAERQRDLHTIDVFRERRKKTVIAQSLKDEITTKHTIHASFGQAHYFEFLFTNPYDQDHNFEISWFDSELRIVLNPAEWKYLRRIHGHANLVLSEGLILPTTVEDVAITLRPEGTSAEIFMTANETVAIPFVFQSLVMSRGGGKSIEGAIGRQQPGLKHGGRDEGILGWDAGGTGRVIEIAFLNSTKKSPVSLLQVTIQPHPHFASRSFRIFSAENESVRKVIRYTPTSFAMPSVSNTVYDSAKPHLRYLRCNAPDVVCSLSDDKHTNNTTELSFKYRAGAAPDTRILYFLFFDDPFHCSLSEIWQLFAHSLHRIDVNGILGQTNSASLVLRGPTFSRTVCCYSSKPDELVITSPNPFTLAANTLNEVEFLLRPTDLQSKEIILNIVDVNAHTLVSSWLIVPHINAPLVTKSFEIVLPRGKSANKRVSFTNPYSKPKTFYLKTNKPHLVQFKDTILNLQPGETRYIGLRFIPPSSMSSTSPAGAMTSSTFSGQYPSTPNPTAPSLGAKGADILVFLNDDMDKIEE